MNKPSINKLWTGCLVISALFIQSNGALAASFKDVPTTYPQFKAIDELQMGSVINGYADKTFKPDKLITRGEFLKMAFNDIGYRAAPTTDKSAFADVPSNNWIAPYVKKALMLNILSANGTNPLFNPTGTLNRADAIKMAFQISGIPTPYYTDIDPTELFKDVGPKAWYGYLARAAKTYGITTVKQPDLFWANHLMTRGDAAELIYETQLVREANDLPGGTVTGGGPSVGFDPNDPSYSELLNNPKFGILLNVWKRANSDFYYQDNVNQDELVYGAVQGMVDKLNDQYTVFEEPTDAANLQQYLEGQFEGIGTVMDVVNDKFVIVKTLPGSPAEKAGLKTGDVVDKINNLSIEKLTEDQVLDQIRGDAGTSIHLSILRDGKSMEFDITRAQIVVSAVNGEMMNGIAEISVSEFTQTSADDFTAMLNQLNKQSPKGYIIDLRGNPGGYLDSAVGMLAHFVPTGTRVVSTRDNKGRTLEITSPGTGELKGKPLVVLVDANSASAAEIMAGAIQDLKVGKLVGVKTFGKGSVQEISNYSDNSLLKITIAHWLTPNGTDINGKGLTPDVDVELDKDQLLKGVDTQLQKGIDTINAF